MKVYALCNPHDNKIILTINEQIVAKAREIPFIQIGEWTPSENEHCLLTLTNGEYVFPASEGLPN